eukprot:scaffold281649_cov26-Tisochrysis_lutea.AAC.1
MPRIPFPPPTSKTRRRCLPNVALDLEKPHVGVTSSRFALPHSPAISVDFPAWSQPSTIHVCSALSPGRGAGTTLRRARRDAANFFFGLSGGGSLCALAACCALLRPLSMRRSPMATVRAIVARLAVTNGATLLCSLRPPPPFLTYLVRCP